MERAVLSPRLSSSHTASPRSLSTSRASWSSPGQAAAESASAVMCSAKSRAAPRSVCQPSCNDSARAFKRSAVAWHTAANSPATASCSRITRATRRCTITTDPSPVKVTNDAPASAPSARLPHRPPGHPRPGQRPEHPRWLRHGSKSRPTPEADSTDTRFITASHPSCHRRL